MLPAFSSPLPPLLQEQFPEYPELLRLAISLGRRMQEPLHEFSSLMTSEDEEILALKMHPLQDSLPKVGGRLA